MSRIRSVHPGLYTDEAWATVSIAARWLAVGLMTEADDNGIFEWKPLQIKMRLYPVDAVDVAELLTELAGANIVRCFEIGDPTILARHGRRPVQLGAIRNFARFQKPRKPKAWHPITPDIQRYIGLEVTDDGNNADSLPGLFGSEPQAVEAQVVPQNEERGPLMEDGRGRMDDGVGGGRMEMEEGIPPTPLKPPEPFVPPEPEWSEFVHFRKRINAPFTDHARKLACTALAKLADDGNDPREVINRSILNGWKGLFALPEERGKPKRPTRPTDTSPPTTQVNGEPQLCSDIRKGLLERIGPGEYLSWFQRAHLVVDRDQLRIEHPSKFQSDRCKTDYGDAILKLVPEGIETIAFTTRSDTS